MIAELEIGVGQIVWGHPHKSRAFGVAFPKNEFKRDIWPVLKVEQAVGYPDGVPTEFSWKYVDGDDQQFANREGYAGCYVLTFKNAYTPPIYKFENGTYREPDEIRCGDWIAITTHTALNIAVDHRHKSGSYNYPVYIEFSGYGIEIHNAGQHEIETH